MAKDFHEFAKAKGLTNDSFPHAKFGSSLYNVFCKLLTVIIVAGISSIVLFGVSSSVKTMQINVPDFENSDASAFLVQNDQTPMKNIAEDISGVISGIAKFTQGVALLLLYIDIFIAVLYGVNTIRRWRYFERKCLRNDMKARHLKNSLLRSLNVQRRLKEARQKLPDANAKSNINVQSEGRVEALKAMKKLEVLVNTRQSLDSEELETRYCIVMQVPYIETEAEEFLKLIKNLDSVATKLMHNKVSFGAMTMSSDRSQVVFQDVVIEIDKYADIDDEVEDDRPPSQYSFPLSLLVDKQGEIDSKKDKAKAWANNTADALDKMLATKETAAKRLGVNVGNTNALFTYELSFKLELQSIDRMGELIDNVFKTSGTDVKIDAGNLQITVPLPKNLKIPINVPTMYKEVFGPEIDPKPADLKQAA